MTFRKKANPGKMHVKMRGFTLVEVLVVVFVILFLATILMPVLNRVRQRSLLTKCVANQRQLYIGWAVYAQENNGRMLQISDGTLDWNGLLFSVIPNTNTHNQRNVLTVYQCPANPCRLGENWYGPNYGYNGNLGDYADIPGDTEKIQNYRPLAKVQRPNELVILADASVWVDRGEGFGDVNNRPRWLCHRSLHGGLIPNPDGSEPARSVGYQWHGGVANFLFADGHAETLSSAEVRRRDREDNPSGDGTIRRSID